MTLPTSTYRIQFREGMDFARAATIVPYLKRLGISHFYASPIFTATSGSTHGYDVTDHNELDPALGGEEGFKLLTQALAESGLGLILDIVPNHMSAHIENPWWQNIIEWGEQSPYAHHFDVNWSEKLTLPILGQQSSQALAEGEIGFALDAENGFLGLSYFETIMPIDPKTYGQVLRTISGSLAPKISKLADGATPTASDQLHEAMKALAADKTELELLQSGLKELSKNLELVEQVHEAQAWRFMFWRNARRRLSYRRFFEVTGLVGVKVEDRQVFDDVHALIFQLVEDGTVDGLRVDHVDGLANPKHYLERLRTAAGPDTYLVVEKILEASETIPSDWPISGTTGYEFIAALAGVLVDNDQAQALDGAYYDVLGRVVDIEEERRQAKSEILYHNLEAELSGLTQMALAIATTEPGTPIYNETMLKQAIADLMMAFPVYRLYGDRHGQPEEDRALLETIAQTVRDSRPGLDPEPLEFIVRVLALEVAQVAKLEAREFVVRFQQTTGPVMAKAVEDTLFYRRNRLIALNEVGGDPEARDGSVAKFHEIMAARVTSQPEGMLATATHDTKRGEDARARLYAISEAPTLWADAVARWREMANHQLRWVGDQPAPGREVEWLIYQALAGFWPLDLDLTDEAAFAALRERFSTYLEKAMREAKTRTNWTSINEPYETAVQDYAAQLLSPDNTEFLQDFAQTTARFFRAGALNGLAQTALKLGAPGIPDIYQGTESWEFSLVDPDNRRDIDFDQLSHQLDTLDTIAPAALLANWKSGAIKQRLVHAGLKARAAKPALFTHGQYTALEVEGGQSEHIIAFLRSDGYDHAIIIAPRLTLGLLDDSDAIALPASVWGGTTVSLPENTGVTNLLSGKKITGGKLKIADVLADFPVALLTTFPI